MTPDLQSAIVSGAIGLLGAIIGAMAVIASTWFAKKLQSSGKVSLFVRTESSKGNVRPGCYLSNGYHELFMRIPLWIEIINTCGISRIVRNLNLYAYADKEEVAAFTQLQDIGYKEEILLGDKGSYTFVIPANSACRFDVEFILRESEVPQNKRPFDEIVLTYYDEKNRIHAFNLPNIDFCWCQGEFKAEKEWITLDKECSYANHRKAL